MAGQCAPQPCGHAFLTFSRRKDRTSESRASDAARSRHPVRYHTARVEAARALDGVGSVVTDVDCRPRCAQRVPSAGASAKRVQRAELCEHVWIMCLLVHRGVPSRWPPAMLEARGARSRSSTLRSRVLSSDVQWTTGRARVSQSQVLLRPIGATRALWGRCMEVENICGATGS